jgi:RNA polymerase sigma-70 factor (ECF subfamily)
MTDFPETRGTLLAAIKNPDNRVAWEEFVLIYRPVIYRMARRRGMQDADAQDVTQNILVRISTAIEKYEQEPGKKFRSWLRRVARNAIFTVVSQFRLDAAKGGSVAHDLLSEQVDVAPEFEQEIEKEYLREQFLRAAAIVRSDVHPETWQSFELTVVQGHSCTKAAELTGKSIGAVYAARSRIVKRLREQIDRLEGRQS